VRGRLVAIVVLLALATGACGGGRKAGAPNTAAYLTIVHSPLLGTPATSDADALAQGRKACADMDRGMGSDAVVADLAGDPEPGSAAFNSAAYVVAAAAKELCPAHNLQ
jgi:hypothetical protein